jgi:hypothetical protein
MCGGREKPALPGKINWEATGVKGNSQINNGLLTVSDSDGQRQVSKKDSQLRRVRLRQ